MNESKTPRTDASLKVLHPGVQPSTWYVQAEFARQLERELSAALARAEKAEAEKDRLQMILDSRPAINAGLPDSYIKWSRNVTECEIVKVIGTDDAAIEQEKKHA